MYSIVFTCKKPRYKRQFFPIFMGSKQINQISIRINMTIPFTKHPFLLTLGLLLIGSMAWAQRQTNLDIALRYMEQHRAKWNLSEKDIADMAVSSEHTSKHNGVNHMYFIQRHSGIEIHNAITGIHVGSDGKVVHVANRFVPEIASKINTTAANLSAIDAIEAAANHLDLNIEEPLRLLSQDGARLYTYTGANISNSNIPVKLVYQHLWKTNEIRLAWDLSIDMVYTSDMWSIRVDALTGEILDQNNWTVSCSFGKREAKHVHNATCSNYDPMPAEFSPVKEVLFGQNKVMTDNAQYNVFPTPAESPIHGERELVVDPADPMASPQGWHDTNGLAGADFTITRGNNVHAFQDRNGTNQSSSDEPDGGVDLIFDFFFDDQNSEPEDYTDAAVVQLFYMNNIIHDFTFAYGFDEEAGNFQANNYGGGQGLGGDYVRAQAQDGIDLDPEEFINNANFGSPPDGQNGRMQMFLWNTVSADKVLTVNEPPSLSGQQYNAQPATFGGAITTAPLTGEVVIVDDGNANGSLGCDPPVNDVSGKIALIDRGICEFGLKILNAEEAGAIAVIMCNYEDDLVNMGAGDVGNQVTIPSAFMTVSDCATIRQFAGESLVITLQLPEESAEGPTFLDGDFDNGIIAHEYGHGISNRLTGGRLAANCLGNDEQMGEGWSDIFTLITTVKPGDTGDLPRGIGNYVNRAGIDGGGIRQRPYTNNFVINGLTYKDALATGSNNPANPSAPHPLGTVWASTLWDMYWAFVDEYGFDEDQIYGTGGNNMAIQLIMDGMKFQECSPGFIDGREGILKADSVNNGAANACLIWEVFARRGVGYSAAQGNNNQREDGFAAFDIPPACRNQIVVEKEVTELINPGDEVEVSIKISNFKGEIVSGVILTDELPEGLTFNPGSETGATGEVDGGIVSFDIGDLAVGQTMTVTYTATSAVNYRSAQLFLDDVEDGDDNWLIEAPTGFSIWDRQDIIFNSGENAWFVENTPGENDQVLKLFVPYQVTGTQPVLRFFHQYNIEYVFDGGLVEVSTDGSNWEQIGDLMFRNGYERPLHFQTLGTPGLNVFSGTTDDEFIATYVDLRPYLGQEIQFRFRFVSDQWEGEFGWIVDDIEIMDMFNYDGEACVTSTEGDNECAKAEGRGTIVESAVINSTDDPEQKPVELAVYPNPAKEVINVAISSETDSQMSLEIMSADGKVLLQKQQRINNGYELIPVNISALSSGFYLVKVTTEDSIVVEKIAINN